MDSLYSWTNSSHLQCLYLFLFFFFLMIRRPPRSTPFPTRRSSDLALVLVLVGDLAHDLFQEVLDRHEPRDAAIFVHDDRHPEVPALEFPQQLRDLLGLRHEVRFTRQLRETYFVP